MDQQPVYISATVLDSSGALAAVSSFGTTSRVVGGVAIFDYLGFGGTSGQMYSLRFTLEGFPSLYSGAISVPDCAATNAPVAAIEPSRTGLEAQNVTVLGWRFEYVNRDQILCKYLGVLQPAIFVDCCHVLCELPAHDPVSGVLQVSFDGGEPFDGNLEFAFVGPPVTMEISLAVTSYLSSSRVELVGLGVAFRDSFGSLSNSSVTDTVVLSLVDLVRGELNVSGDSVKQTFGSWSVKFTTYLKDPLDSDYKLTATCGTFSATTQFTIGTNDRYGWTLQLNSGLPSYVYYRGTLLPLLPAQPSITIIRPDGQVDIAADGIDIEFQLQPSAQIVSARARFKRGVATWEGLGFLAEMGQRYVGQFAVLGQRGISALVVPSLTPVSCPVDDVMPSELHPSKSTLAATVVTIKGYAFPVNISTPVVCRFGNTSVPVTILDGCTGMCLLPAVPAAVLAPLEILVDSQVKGSLPFAFVGPPAALSSGFNLEPLTATNTEGSPILPSGVLVKLPNISISAVDAIASTVDSLYPNVTLTVTAATSLTSSPGNDATSLEKWFVEGAAVVGELSQPVIDGRALFSGLSVVRPLKGIHYLGFSSSSGFKNYIQLEISVGSAAALRFRTPPYPFTTNRASLPRAPEVEVIDAAGNLVDTDTGFMKVEADPAPSELLGREEQAVAGVAKFSSLRIRGNESAEYQLEFAHSSASVQPISTTIRIAICPASDELVDSLYPARGGLEAATVTIKGYAFTEPTPTEPTRCRFDSVEVEAVFVDTCTIICVLPERTFPASKPLQVAPFGKLFTGNKMYSFIAPMAGIAPASSVPVVYQADFTTALQPLVLQFVDAAGTPLLEFDSGTREVFLDNITRSVTIPALPDDTVAAPLRAEDFLCDAYTRTLAMQEPVLLGRRRCSSRNGECVFSDLRLAIPVIGTYMLNFSVPHLGYTTSALLIVTPGHAQRLCFTKLPSTQTDNSDPRLRDQPRLRAVDPAGNMVSVYSQACTAYFSEKPHDSSGWVVGFQADSGGYVFDQLSFRGYHGHSYQLTFTASGLDNITSPAIYVKRCIPGSQYALLDTITCLTCPANAICDGTSVILAEDNYWRANTESLTFYQCPRSKPCKGSTPTGSCKLGYKGPLCSVCQNPQYGRSGVSCTRCPSRAVSIVQLVAIFAGVVAALSFVVYRNMQGEVGELSILIKLAINFLHVNSKVGELRMQLPKLVEEIFSAQSQSVYVGNQIASLDCVGITTATKFIAIMALPPFVFALPFVIVNTWRLFSWLKHRRAKPEDQVLRRESTATQPHSDSASHGDAGSPRELDRRRSTDFSRVASVRFARAMSRKRHSSGQGDDEDLIAQQHGAERRRHSAKLVAFIVLFFIYPNLSQQCAVILKCSRWQFGTSTSPDWRSLLDADRSIDCDSESHIRLRLAAVIFAVIYGFGIPLGFVLLIVVLRNKYVLRYRHQRLVSRLLFFWCGAATSIGSLGGPAA
eukprot:TRINITY_DN1199_c1_g1_i3.p1 TRINITY_DN1199_c1_g1~~TRINITY_DN1199_c1_g1_i3.p1  ORF type:complete len:1507 (+),score=206.33 TRINITY_DN1199_c1_g1_i3:111-4523(+)